MRPRWGLGEVVGRIRYERGFSEGPTIGATVFREKILALVIVRGQQSVMEVNQCI